MSKLPAETDVIVIGGGPAGAAAAIRAAQLGHSVCLIERGGARWHHGHTQSLAPGALPLLDTIEVRDKIEARFPAASGVVLLWGNDRPQCRDFQGAGGLHIERSAFDRVMRRAAARAGAAVVLGATVLEARHESGASPAWAVRVAAGGRTITMRAPTIVDAAGRNSTVRGLRPPGSALRLSLPLLAILGRWSGGRLHGALVEAANDRWYWAGCSGDGAVTAAVFLDPRARPCDDGNLTRTCESLVRASRLLDRVVCGAPTRVIACDATGRHAHDPIGTRSIRVGEAALSVDPLSSQGIQTALVAGLQAAVVLNTWLRQPSRAAAADSFYRERHAEMVENSRINSARIYAEAAHRFATPFWCKRSGAERKPVSFAGRRPSDAFPDPSTPVRLAAGVQVTCTAVVRRELAEFAPAIVSADGDRPVAFVDDVPVGELAALVSAGMPAAEVVRAWCGRVGQGAAMRALSWMWQAGVIAADTKSIPPEIFRAGVTAGERDGARAGVLKTGEAPRAPIR
jgi:2-polyprenyl-6-methoxyphenol hydroxylase-like FAD-dependent oxidoreductase